MRLFSDRLSLLSGLILGSSLLCQTAWGDPMGIPYTDVPAQFAPTPGASVAVGPPSVIPWLTGPLLTPSGHVIPYGHFNTEPYQFVTTVYGAYNSKWNSVSIPQNFYTYLTSVPFQWGFAPYVDFQLTMNVLWKHTSGASHWNFGDMVANIDYQLLMDEYKRWWPAIRLTTSLNLPVGNYRRLKPSSKGTDIGGSGSWDPGVALTFSKLFFLPHHHFLTSRLFFGYTPTVSTHVSGLNAYGGGLGTRGKVYPGNSFTCLFGMEYTLAQKWALAIDIDYTRNNKTRFSGRTVAPVGAPSSDQFSLAPAFEYNWSPYYGLIAGCWFTIAGRNTAKFASAVVAINVYH